MGKPGFQERTPCTVEGLRGGRRGEDWRVPKKQNWLQALEGKSICSGSGEVARWWSACLAHTRHWVPFPEPEKKKKNYTSGEKEM